MIRLTIPGEVVPQLRPRFARHGNYVQTYDPEKCRNYKAYVRMLAAQKMTEKPIEGPVEVWIRVYRQPPTSWSKAKTTWAITGTIRPTTKPDLTNLVKGIKDAVKGIIWRDDAQVVRLVVEKWYSDVPRAEMEIIELPYPCLG
jgi:Holliday junction resolvase RusA-like endonuclease